MLERPAVDPEFWRAIRVAVILMLPIYLLVAVAIAWLNGWL